MTPEEYEEALAVLRRECFHQAAGALGGGILIGFVLGSIANVFGL